jgi:hypothetical protein
MRRLRAVAAIVALAVIWLGYSVARQIAAELGNSPALQSKAEPAVANDEPTIEIVRRSPPSAAIAGPLGESAVPASVVGELPSPDLPAPSTSLETPAAAAATQLDPLPAAQAHVPFFQSALFDVQGGVMPGTRGQRGAFGGGGVPSMGGGGGGGTVANEPALAEEILGSGDGVAHVLGRRLSGETEESAGNSGTNSNSGNSNGGGNSSNAGDSNSGNSSGNDSSNGNSGGSNQGGGNTPGGNSPGGNTGSGGESNHGGAGGNTPGGPNPGGSNAGAGESNKAGGPGDDGGVGGVQGIAANIDQGPGTDVHTVPEPGVILLGLGAAAALVRRRTRARPAKNADRAAVSGKPA